MDIDYIAKRKRKEDLSGDLEEGCANHNHGYHDCGYGLKLFTGSVTTLGGPRLQGVQSEEVVLRFSGGLSHQPASSLCPRATLDFCDSLFKHSLMFAC